MCSSCALVVLYGGPRERRSPALPSLPCSIRRQGHCSEFGVAWAIRKFQRRHRAPAIEHHQLGTQYRWNPDEYAAKKNAAPTGARNLFPNISSQTERGRLRKKVGNNNAHFSNECFCAHVMSKTAPSSNIAQRTHSEPTWAKNFAKILRRLDRAWAAAPRARTTLRLSDP